MTSDYPPFDADRWTDQVYRRSERGGGPGNRDRDFSAWQGRTRESLRTVLGLDRIERSRGDHGVRFRRVGTERRDGYDRQKWVAETEPGFHVPFYLLLPDDGDAPHPTVLTVHGHCDNGKELAVGRYRTDEQKRRITDEGRDIAAQAVERGYAAVAPDMRGFGELAPAVEGDNTCRMLQMRAQLFGRSLAGERVWDVLRLLEFVEDAEELDGDRIGITGHSGGGAVAMFAGALDERFSVVAPCCYFCTFADSILSIEHCACNYVPGLLELGEMWAVAGLTAPRPLLVAAGAEDEIFPVEGTRRAFDRLRDVYDAAGASDQCSLAVGEGGHRYYGGDVWPFVDTHL